MASLDPLTRLQGLILSTVIPMFDFFGFTKSIFKCITVDLFGLNLIVLIVQSFVERNVEILKVVEVSQALVYFFDVRSV